MVNGIIRNMKTASARPCASVLRVGGEILVRQHSVHHVTASMTPFGVPHFALSGIFFSLPAFATLAFRQRKKHLILAGRYRQGLGLIVRK